MATRITAHVEGGYHSKRSIFCRHPCKNGELQEAAAGGVRRPQEAGMYPAVRLGPCRADPKRLQPSRMEEVALVKAPAHLVSSSLKSRLSSLLGTENKISPKPLWLHSPQQEGLGFCVGLVSWYFWLCHACCLRDLRSPTMRLFFKKKETEVGRFLVPQALVEMIKSWGN